ncbi:pyridoxal phosphate-dependent decarboxylase family protein [Spirosoma koreense]
MATPRETPIQIPTDEFRKIGYQLIDAVADFMEALPEKPVTTGKSPGQLQTLLGNRSLPEDGTAPADILATATDLLFSHSLFNGHPKFLGYITSSPAPIGALADLLAATVNPNVGANVLSPMATEIEKQTIRWLAELIGVSPTYGGLLVSGGNMANFTAFIAARTAKAPKAIKEEGIAATSRRLLVYCSKTTHTWIEKAAILFGLGANAIRWIETGSDNKMNNTVLEQTIREDIGEGYQPMMVIGTAGNVSTGVVDDLNGIASICKTYDLWFHIDGAYGIPAAVIPELNEVFEGIQEADSIALDPHKWLYSPLEAGCTLVKNPNHLLETYSSHPVYYNFSSPDEGATLNYYEYGFQNSRGFRALKVWLGLQQVGRRGYRQMIGEDIALARLLFELASNHAELEAVTQHLSITTLRYIPPTVIPAPEREAYLNRLNEALLNDLQQGGQAFLSNAVVGGAYCLRACIVNFRTSKEDIADIVEIIVRAGRDLHRQLHE